MIDSEASAVAKEWRSKRCIRLHGAFEHGVLAAAYAELPSLSFELSVSFGPGFAFQYWKRILDEQDPPAIERLVAWLTGPGLAWAREVTGLQLVSPPARSLAACLYTKGCFLDVHNDRQPGRAVAYVIGLTPETWPPDEGGQLSFHETLDGPRTETRAPGWNTLDLFDVRQGRWHGVSMLRTHRQRYVIAGWFHEAPSS